MQLSRSALTALLWSCFLHSVALSLAATLMVSQPQRSFRPVRITLLQQATPLPSGEAQTLGNPPPPIERPALSVPAPIAHQPKAAKSTAKPQSSPAVALKTAVPRRQKEYDPPQESVLPSQSETLPKTLPPVAAVGSAAVSGLDSEAISLMAGTDTHAQQDGSMANRAKAGNGEGKRAQPDYGVNPKPPYPMLARRLGAQGVVLLRVYVREDGSVANVELARSSGFSMLDESATRTVRESWRFVPARIDDAPTASWVEVPIRFVLADS